jgi:hypothetical protein
MFETRDKHGTIHTFTYNRSTRNSTNRDVKTTYKQTFQQLLRIQNAKQRTGQKHYALQTLQTTKYEYITQRT